MYGGRSGVEDATRISLLARFPENYVEAEARRPAIRQAAIDVAPGIGADWT
jgi:hypothetical protein